VTNLVLSEIFPPKTGGSGRWFWEVYRRLPRDHYVIAAGEDARHKEFDRSHDLRIERLPLTLRAWGLRSVEGLRGYWRALTHLRPLARARRVRRVHCGRCLPEGLMALALKLSSGVPYLCYVHGEDVSTAVNSREHTWLVRRVLAGADFLIANSRNTAEILRTEWRVHPERVCVLHPGVDTRYFVPAETDPAVRARLGWGRRPVVLTVGRLQKRKGHDHMILALRSVRRTIPDVLYAVVGKGEEGPELRALVQSQGLDGHVQFLGEVGDSDLRHCYQQCDLFALPNRQVDRDIEGFGMVLLEAQACGKPVLAGDSGGTAETMRIPETGRVVCCDGPDDLAAQVTELLADQELRGRMGAAGRNWVVEQFDWEALARKAARVFRHGPAARANSFSPVPARP
jgi:phosphatidylinositol alpha-1,6-mannosyltransferase